MTFDEMKDLGHRTRSRDLRCGEDQAGHIRSKAFNPNAYPGTERANSAWVARLTSRRRSLESRARTKRGRCDMATVADNDIPPTLDLSEQRDDLGWCIREVASVNNTGRLMSPHSARTAALCPVLWLHEHDVSARSARLRRSLVREPSSTTRSRRHHRVHGREVAS